MHSSRMRTAIFGGRLSCTHTPPAMHALPCMPLPHTPPTMYAPTIHAYPLPCSPPSPSMPPISPCTPFTIPAPFHHKCPPFTMSAPPLGHTCPLCDAHSPSLPCMPQPPPWTEWQRLVKTLLSTQLLFRALNIGKATQKWKFVNMVFAV